MSDLSDVSRYGLRKRPVSDVFPQKRAKQNRSSSPQPDAPSGVARSITPNPDTGKVTTSTQTSMSMSTPCRGRLAPNPSANNTKSSPHQLTINGRTFTGPLPPTAVTNPAQDAANIPDDHNNYKLFVCADYCPVPQKEKDKQQPDFHSLCYPSHPCIWSFPPKAREAFANRRHWLALNKPLEGTRRPNGRLPRLLDEDGESVTRGLMAARKGEDANKAYDEVVMRRYLAVVRDDECCELRGLEKGERERDEYRFLHRAGREAMLEDMGWGFKW